MSGFSSPQGGFVHKKNCTHVWDWIRTFLQAETLEQDRKCMKCKLSEHVAVCRDRVICEECNDPECSCVCHTKKKS